MYRKLYTYNFICNERNAGVYDYYKSILPCNSPGKDSQLRSEVLSGKRMYSSEHEYRSFYNRREASISYGEPFAEGSFCGSGLGIKLY